MEIKKKDTNGNKDEACTVPTELTQTLSGSSSYLT